MPPSDPTVLLRGVSRTGTRSRTGQIEILPDDDNLLHTWSDNGSAHTGEYFAYPEDDRFMYPAFLKLSFNGGGGTGVTLKEIVLDVEKSDVETRPFIAVIGTGMQEVCGPEFQAYRPVMNITNTGWGTLQSAELLVLFRQQGDWASLRALHEETQIDRHEAGRIVQGRTRICSASTARE